MKVFQTYTFTMVNFSIFYLFFTYFCAFSVGIRLPGRRERSSGESWGYTLENGPSTWGGECQTGKSQSPINIRLGDAIPKNFPPFVFQDDYLSRQKFYAKNNGHTIYVGLKSDLAEPVFTGGGLKDKFLFEQLHFHWESEHEFDGKRADLEMHIVHYNSKYKSFAEASTKSDGIAVFAVIFDETNETDHKIDKFFEFILHSANPEEDDSILQPYNNLLSVNDDPFESYSIALRDLLPNDTSKLFRYEGSLTTPNCNEVVQWTIFIQRLPVSNKTLTALRTLKDHDGNTLLHNFRPPQKLNGREVYVQIQQSRDQKQPESEGLTGGGSSIKPSVIFFVLYSCFYTLFRIN